MTKHTITPEVVQLPFREFMDAVTKDADNLPPEELDWVLAWNCWDFANSPMQDVERQLIRYGHYLGWFAHLTQSQHEGAHYHKASCTNTCVNY